MKDNKIVRHDLLQVTTMNKTGKYNKKAQKGAAYLTVTKGFNEPWAQIVVEVSHSSGVGQFRRTVEHEKALIMITFPCGKAWAGNFDDLERLLLPGNYATGTFRSDLGKDFETKVFKNADDANQYLVSHPEYGVLGEDSTGVHVALCEDKGKP